MIRRLFYFIVAAAAVFILSRALIRSLPGDPLDSLLAETALSIPREKIADDLGLNLGFFELVRRDIVRLFHGDLGYSLITREPVLHILLPRLGRTVMLSAGAMIVALMLGVPAGLFCSSAQNSGGQRILARIVRASTTLLISIPIAWIGPVTLYIFAILLPWVEFHGSWTLACVVLALPLAGNWARIIEVRTREEMQYPYFRAALARGVPRWKAVLKNGLAPSAGALLAALGSQAGALLAGSFITEWIFDWPGMGVAWVQATLQRDYPVMEGATFLGALACLAGVLVGDILQQLWDPRQREDFVP